MFGVVGLRAFGVSGFGFGLGGLGFEVWAWGGWVFGVWVLGSGTNPERTQRNKAPVTHPEAAIPETETSTTQATI